MQCDYGKEDKFKHVRISKIQRIFMEVRLIFFFKVLFLFVKGRHGRPVRYLILGIFVITKQTRSNTSEFQKVNKFLWR